MSTHKGEERMTDDWRPGDRALCVDDRFFNGPKLLAAGAAYTVVQVGAALYCSWCGTSLPTVTLLEVKSRVGHFCSGRFQKQPPLATETTEHVEQQEPVHV